jgi:hypothetical protein
MAILERDPYDAIWQLRRLFGLPDPSIRKARSWESQPAAQSGAPCE